MKALLLITALLVVGNVSARDFGGHEGGGYRGPENRNMNQGFNQHHNQGLKDAGIYDAGHRSGQVQGFNAGTNAAEVNSAPMYYPDPSQDQMYYPNN